MGVIFRPGQEAVRGDLDIFVKNCERVPTNPALISYALYYVDPGPPELEVLIGAVGQVPVNPAVGEFYAALMVPTEAIIGDYRIRWTLKETVNSAVVEVVTQFGVVADATLNTSPYSDVEKACIDTLRIMLRDNCVGGEETVELDVEGERMVVRMDDLWETLHELNPSP